MMYGVLFLGLAFGIATSVFAAEMWWQTKCKKCGAEYGSAFREDKTPNELNLLCSRKVRGQTCNGRYVHERVKTPD